MFPKRSAPLICSPDTTGKSLLIKPLILPIYATLQRENCCVWIYFQMGFWMSVDSLLLLQFSCSWFAMPEPFLRTNF